MNFFKNADFSLWEDQKPCDWILSGGVPQETRLGALSGKSTLQIREFDEKNFPCGKKLSQRVRLSPNTTFRLNIKMYAPGSFFLKVRLVDVDSGEVVSEEDLGWSSFLYWQDITAELKSDLAEEYLFEIDFRSENKVAGRVVFELARIDIEPACRSGIFLFTHSVMQSYEANLPPESILQPREVFQTAIRNEYHPFVAGMKTNRNIKAVEFVLLDSGGLSCSDIKIYRITKQLLAKNRPVAVEENQMQRWWINFSPSATANPGLFYLKFKLIADDVEQSLALELNILDIALPEADIPMAVYYSEKYMPVELLTEELRRKYYTDMREHGMTSVTVYNNPDSEESQEPDFEHNWQYSPSEHRWHKKNYPEGLLSGEEDWTNRFNWGLNREMAAMMECGLCRDEFPVMWLVGKEGLIEGARGTWGAMSSREKIAKSLAQWKNQEGWPEPLYQVVDEPCGHEERIRSAREIFSSLKKIRGAVRTVTANVAPGELGDQYDVWVQPVYKISEKYNEWVRAAGGELWTYDCSTSNRNMAMGRALYGFWAGLTGVKGVAMWAYYDAGINFADQNGEPKEDRSFTTLSRVALSPEGPVSTLSWEAVREGTIDFRIVRLFCDCHEKLLEVYKAAVPGERKERLKELLDQVREVYERVLQSIPLGAFAPLKAESRFKEHQMFKPAVGPGNPDLSAEIKRQALLPHIIQMISILKGSES